MSQEYTEDKEVQLKRLSSGRRLLEALLVLVVLFALYLMASLLSFNPSDPSWSQTAWHEPIHNLGGGTGAWLADTLFFIFGVIAYAIPVIIVGGCWFIWKQRDAEYLVDYFALSLRLIGVLAMVLTSCGLAAINADDIWYFASGGVIGSLLSTALQPMLNSSGGTLALLCIWATGLTLFTGWSWVGIAEKIGSFTMGILTFASNHTRRDDTWQDEEEYEDEDLPEAEKKPGRKARLLRGALSRKQRLKEKFAQSHTIRSDEVLFSGKRMDDVDDPLAVPPAPAAQMPIADADDVLFSGHKVTSTPEQIDDPLFSGQTALSPEYQETAAVDENHHWQPGQQPAASVPAPQPQGMPSQTMPPQQMPAENAQPQSVPPGGMAHQQTHAQQMHAQQMQPQNRQPQQLPPEVSPPQFMAPPSDQPVQTPVAQSLSSASRVSAGQPDRDWLLEPNDPLTAPWDETPPAASTPGYARPDAQPLSQPAAGDEAPASASAPEQAPEAGVKPSRPPLYYFEEVEEKRAREREQLAAWYQPVDEPAAVKQSPAPATPKQSQAPAAADRSSPGISPVAAAVASADKVMPGPQVMQVAGKTGGVVSSAASASAFNPVFGIANDASAPRAQVKEGIGPQLPRPNRVRVPTRRELASYGIKLPSQRMAEAQARQERNQQNEASSLEEENELQQQELARQFAEQQHQRYGDYPEQDRPNDEEIDDDAAMEAELSRQFAAQQQQRYAATSSPAAPVFSLDDFDFQSPMKELVDDGPIEPLFTPIAEPVVQQTPAASPPSPAAGGNHGQTNAYAQPSSPAYSPAGHSHAPAQAASSAVAPQFGGPSQGTAPAAKDSLIHPFLMRNGDSQPLQKPTTPLPSLDLLSSPPATVEPVDDFAMQQMARLVEARLADYRIKADVVDYSPGPVITRFELDLAPGVKAARISNLSKDLARSLSTVAVRVVEVIPGKPYVGLELPNKKRQTVYLREVLDCPKFRDSHSPLTVVLGKDIGGEPVVADLAKMPHLLVAGTTGSGKSVGVNAMILSMLYKAQPEDVRFIMIDPKMLELSVYEGIPHLLTEVVTDMKDAANALRWSVNEMERRYKLMSALGVRNLAGYNERVLEAEEMGRPIPDPFWKPGDSMEASHPMLEKLPYIVVLVDEFADLMMTVGKKVEELIARLAQKARAAGIHLVLATQRPSVDVITGLIKANIPTRIAFTVSSKIDSRTILDQGGAESLLGMGDMLYSGPNSTTPIRVHGAFVRDEEVHAVVQDWKARGRPKYISEITSADGGEGGGGGLDGDEELDPLFDQAVAFVVEKRKASISGVQRQFRIGYNRAARIVEQMEAQGIVSPPGHNGNREVLAPPPFE